MSRTYRRRGQTHEYRWVLREGSVATPWWAHALLDRHSREGRRAIARFHSDAEVTMRSGAPHWFCRIFKRRQRNADTRELGRWLADPGYDPVMQIAASPQREMGVVVKHQITDGNSTLPGSPLPAPRSSLL